MQITIHRLHWKHLVQMWGQKRMVQVSHEGNAHICEYAGWGPINN